MHAVGYRADGHLVHRDRPVKLLEHQPAGLAVELGDAVGHACQAQAHHGHVERGAGGLARGVAQGHQVGDVDATFVRPAGKVLVHEVGWEPIYPGRHGRVSREDRPRPGRLHRLGEREPFLGH